MNVALGACLFGLWLVLMLIERWLPARMFPAIPGWRRKCLGFVPVVLIISLVVPGLVTTGLAGWHVLPGYKLGVLGGTVIGILLSEFVVYWVHRLHHRVEFLWRWIHQLHHSPERVDVYGAAYFHPFEIIEGAVVGALLFGAIMGLDPTAAALATAWQGFNGIFQHGNVHTPQWLGYFIQRPEAHALHHQRHLHGYNYANLSLWDLVFGTFRNPVRWQGDAGFYPGSSKPTLRMLIGHNIANESRQP